jgi:hypothetical protein
VPQAGVIIPLAVFFAMGALTLWLMWRVVVAGGRMRRENAAGRQLAECARRAERSLGDVVGVVDGLRHRNVEPGEVLASLAACATAVRREAVETSGLARARIWGSSAVALGDDLGRAERAIELVAHGAEQLADPHGDRAEGETSVKRGYLNLVHARDALRDRREQVLAAARTRKSGAWEG